MDFDIGHELTEYLLANTENRVAEIYQQASAEMEKKLADYLNRFAAKDAIWRERYLHGEVTLKEYEQWRTGQIMIGNRWREMRDTLATDCAKYSGIARSIVITHMPEAYAINHNYATFQIEHMTGLDTSYTLYSRETVERLIRDNPKLLPPPGERIDTLNKEFIAYQYVGEDMLKSNTITPELAKKFDKLIANGKTVMWEAGKLQSVTLQAILQGESIQHMSQRIAREMGEINRKDTVRYARTAMTGAQNAGRVDAYKRANDRYGIELEQTWLATLDGRTRHDHRLLDNQHVPLGELFEVNGDRIRFPGDPQAPGYLIWNCRCTLVPRVKGINQTNAKRNSKLGDMSYDEWKEGHNPQLTEEQKSKPSTTTTSGPKKTQASKPAPSPTPSPASAPPTPAAPAPAASTPAPVPSAGSPTSVDTLGTHDANFDYDRTREAIRNAREFSEDEHIRDNFDGVWDNLTDKQQSNVRRYTGAGYGHINEHYRDPSRREDEEEATQHITAALDSHALANDTRLFRGLGRVEHLADDMGIDEKTCQAMLDDGSIVGHTFRERAVGSCGINSTAGWNKQVNLDIVAPAGVHGIYVDPISRNRGEQEFLTSNGYVYEILDCTKSNNKYTLKVVIIGRKI